MSSHRDTSSLAQSIPAYSGGHLLQSLTRTRSMRSDHTRQRRHSGDDQTIDEIQIQVGEAALDEADSVRTKDGSAEKGKRWSMTDDLIDLQAKYADSATMVRKLGVTFNNLTVKASQTGVTYQETVLSQFVPRFSTPGQSGQQQVILDNVHGCVKPGEMLLVLGRPGAGCTSLLRMLCNHREGYGHVSGDVKYGNMSSKEAKRYQGQIIMNTEEEIFFPTLTVGQTMDFATRMKVPLHLPKGANSPEEAARVCRDFLLKSMGITHTKDTMVGNEFVRGVSGGERKRVSIVECMATRGSVFCWDNSTRGLDASTALEWTKAMRAMTDVLGLTTIVTLYQAGNGIYDLFDKVLILDEGKQLYYGPRQEAVPFMNELGFYCDPAANKGDFLTGVCVPTERKILEGYESTFPRTNTDIREAYQGSPIRSTMEAEYGYPSSKEAKENTAEFQAIVAGEKARFLPKKSTLTTSFTAQVLNCIVRQYQIMWGDKVTFIIKQVCALIQALVCGSLFYNAPDNSSGLFLKGGALFFGVLYNSLMAMSEVTDSFTGRPVMAKHRAFSLYHPAAFCIAQVVADIPVLLFQITHFGIILYFMAGLKNTADAFFTFWAVLFATTMCMTAMFRACGAAFPTFDSASKVSGGLINASVMYAGYMIHKPDMHPWFVWIYWINPLAYAFESLMGTEFRHATIPCVGPNVIPNGPGDWPNRSCAGISGAVQGADFVTGEQYLGSLSYNDSRVWRNFGIIWAWWLFYIAATIFFTCRWRQQGQGGSNLLVPRTLQRKQVDIEDVPTSTQEKSSGRNVAVNGDGKTRNGADLVRNTSIFTWKNLTYTVKTQSGERKLLDNVQGWVKPGMLAALMGTSGAGKTTLLDVLAQRKTDGTIHGSILVDGRPLSVSFQRSAGYCEQLDVHESFATVREALEFSALLRQPRDVPREEKLAYVDTIIDLLELHDLEHTLIGKVGAGLTIEQRKRVTIGVELVSKPSIIIFLDEPTSGLDGQAAYNTVRFLRKLADVGQAVLVTIHQPSAQLFAQFDSLLLLAKGGKTVYFGDIGEDAKTIKEYFGKRGAPCPEDCNPAEHMIDVVSGTMSQSKDWNEVWLASDEHAKVVKQLDMMIETAANKPPGYKEDGREFATSLWEQTRIVTKRMNVALFRDTEYINSKFTLHIICALFNGFTFWKIGDGVSELQLKLFSIFNFIFVAPGVIAQLQPLFIDRRDIFETREKKSKMYHWAPFVTGLIVSELPYLVLCAIVYFCCWYFTVGFDGAAKYAGSTLFCMIFYEFLYTGMGQFIAAYAPNAVFATLVNPLVIGMLVCFCGVLVPNSQIQEFWRYWIYWINPFNYLIGALLTFALWDKPVNCKPGEFALFNPPSGQTCAAYLTSYLQNSPGANLVNPDAVEGCKVCQYTMGSDYLKTVNIKHYYYGWRDNAIVVLFCFSSYGLVYLFLKLRTKRSKKAE